MNSERVTAKEFRDRGGQKGNKRPNKAKERVSSIAEDNRYSRNDSFEFFDGGVVLFFPGARFISNNVILRNHNEINFPYKKSWESRVARLLNKMVKCEKPIFERVKVEYVVFCEKRFFQDLDGLQNSLKGVIDGFKGLLVQDDTQDHLSSNAPYQVIGDPLLMIVVHEISKNDSVLSDIANSYVRLQPSKGFV